MKPLGFCAMESTATVSAETTMLSLQSLALQVIAMVIAIQVMNVMNLFIVETLCNINK